MIHITNETENLHRVAREHLPTPFLLRQLYERKNPKALSMLLKLDSGQVFRKYIRGHSDGRTKLDFHNPSFYLLFDEVAPDRYMLCVTNSFNGPAECSLIIAEHGGRLVVLKA